MTQIKRIIGISALLLVFTFTAMAQSSALLPYEGATHNYSWGGLQEGDAFAFYMTADAAGTTILDDASTPEFDFNTIPTGTIASGESSASLAINWKVGAAGNQYYLWLQVTAIDGGCSNRIYVGISPQYNAFDLVSENIPVDNITSCPDISSGSGFTALESVYDAGATTLRFKVRRENGTLNPFTAQGDDTYNWSFKPFVLVGPNSNPDVSIVYIQGVNSGIINSVAGVFEVSGLDNEVMVTVSVKNVPNTAQNVTFGVDNQMEDRTNLLDSNSSNNSVTHTIKLMPGINVMNGV